MHLLIALIAESAHLSERLRQGDLHPFMVERRFGRGQARQIHNIPALPGRLIGMYLQGLCAVVAVVIPNQVS